MKYAQLGSSGLVVSRLSVGTMLFGGEGEFYGLKYTLTQNDATTLVAKAIDAGITLFDTANMYNAGQSEIMLGKALGQKRDSVLISTKLGFRVGEQSFQTGINYKQIVEQCEKSLRRLNTDYIDILSLHIEDPITPIEEIAIALEHLQAQGKIRYSGISNFQAWKTACLAEVQRTRAYMPIVSAQMHYSLLNRSLEEEFIPMARHYGIGLMVWSPLSGGFLTGKYSRSNPAPAAARLNTFDLHLFGREFGYTVVDKVTAIARDHGTTPTAISLAWLLHKNYCTTVLIGVSNLNQLSDNLDSTSIALSEGEIVELDKVSKPELRYPAQFLAMQDPIFSSLTT